MLYVAIGISTESVELQTIFCLFPPLALQLACASFRASYQYEDKLPLGNICGMMVGISYL